MLPVGGSSCNVVHRNMWFCWSSVRHWAAAIHIGSQLPFRIQGPWRNILNHHWWIELGNTVHSIFEQAWIWVGSLSIPAHFSIVLFVCFNVPLHPWILALREQDVIQLGQLSLPGGYQYAKRHRCPPSVLYSPGVAFSQSARVAAWPHSDWWTCSSPSQPDLGVVDTGWHTAIIEKLPEGKLMSRASG